MNGIPGHWQWFDEARFGLFIHWGPFSIFGRGEQALNREHMDHREYARAACAWNPAHYSAREWAQVARDAGMRYAVFCSRHHDGYCLWDTRTTDYSSARQAPGRDFVREYVDAFREAGLRVGIYYSLVDWRLPAWFEGPERNPDGFRRAVRYMFDQVEELLSRYGKIDVLWFDGLWPWTSKVFPSHDMVALARRLQPHILINDRLEWPQYSWYWQRADAAIPPEAAALGDFGTPELGVYTKPGHLWESCQVSTWRLWGYGAGERWKGADAILDLLVQCASLRGNLLLNVGPQPDGRLPAPFVERLARIGAWMRRHGEAIYGSEGGDVTEFLGHGRQTVKGSSLYLILRFYGGEPTLRLPDLKSRVTRATLLTTGQELRVEQRGEEVILHGLPPECPTPLFPVIRLDCDGRPEGGEWAVNRTWRGDPMRFATWAATRGTSVWVDGRER